MEDEAANPEKMATTKPEKEEVIGGLKVSFVSGSPEKDTASPRGKMW